MRTKQSDTLFPASKIAAPLDYTPYRMTAAQAREAEEFCRKQREALATMSATQEGGSRQASNGAPDRQPG